MKQVVQNFKTGQTEIVEVPIPRIKKGHILVKTAASLVSAGTERNLVEFAQKSLVGKARSRPELMKQVIEKAKREGLITTIESALNRLDQPLALGYSSAGTIVEIGPDVKNFKPGDRVVCAGGGYAVHAEYAIIPINLTAHLTESVSFEEGAFATMGAIALNGLRLAHPQIGESTAIIGLGLLGFLTAQIAKAAGCSVVGTDINPTRLRLAKKMGLHALTNKQVSDQFLAITEGIGFDHVLICADTSSSDTVELASLIARDRGSVISLGVVGLDLPRKPFFEKELFFQVSRSSGPGRYDHNYEENGFDYPIGYVRWTEGRNLSAFVELIHRGNINVNPLITHQFEITEAVRAYDLVTGKKKEDYLGILLTYPNQDKLNKSNLIISPYSVSESYLEKKIHLGVFGAGNYANAVFLPTIKKHPQVAMIGVAATTGIHAQDSAKKFGFQFSTTSEEEILSNSEINTVAVLTRHDSHADLTIRAMKKGKNVYCEKPIALNIEEIRLIEKELRKEKHPFLMVGFNRRFAPFTLRLQEFFTNRQEPAYINYRVNAGYLLPSHWLHQSSSGGGRLIGEACHFIDYLSFLVGQHPEKVNVASLPDTGKYNQDNFLIVLEYPDGSLGTISYLANGNKNFSKEYIEYFSSGKIGVIDDFRKLDLIDNGKRKRYISHLRQDKGHYAAWESFTNALINNETEPIPYQDIIMSAYTTLACDQSMKTHQDIQISKFMSGA